MRRFKCIRKYLDFTEGRIYSENKEGHLIDDDGVIRDSLITGIHGGFVEVVSTEDTKQTNPKDSIGAKKIPFSVLPAGVLAETACALTEGALKYGRHNYRVHGVRASVYYDAALRHLTDYWEGVDIDEASGIHHVTKAIAGLIVLRDAMLNDKCTDDRPPKHKAGWQDTLNHKVEVLQGKYDGGLPPHTAEEG